MLLSLLAYLLAGVVCFVGLEKTVSEISDQNTWLVYSVLALLWCTTITWMLNSRKIRISIVDIAMAALLAWYLVSYHLNESVAITKVFEICFYISIYVSLRVLFSSHRNLGKWLFIVLCVCGIVEATMGIQQAFGARHSNHSLFRVTGTFFNPGPYGGFLTVIVSTALGYIALRYRYAEKIFAKFKRFRNISLGNILWVSAFAVALCTVIVVAIILPATMSRASFVAVAISTITLILNDRNVYRSITDSVQKHKTRSLTIGIMLFLVICGGAYGIYALKKDSADGRLLMWKIGAKVMMENPATGVGPGYYRGAYGDEQARYFREGERSEIEINIAGSPEYGFNEYLHTGAETGIPGIMLFVFLLAVALKRLLSARSPYAFGLLALMVFAFFSYPFSLLPMNIILVALLAVAGSCSRKQREATVVQRIFVGASLAVCICATAFATKPYLDRIEATKEWLDLRRWYSMERYSYVVDDYPELLPLMGENPTFLFEYGRSLNLEERYTESLEIMNRAIRLSNDPMNYNVIGNNYKAIGEYDKAAEAYLEAHYIIPSRMYPLYLLGKMYLEIGDREQAAHYARRVVAMTPKISSPATDDMQREMREVLSPEK